MEGSGQDLHLRQLAGRCRKLETTLREQFEAVVAARTQLGLVQSMSGPIRQALTIFTIALREVAAAADGPASIHHRRMAREALGGCCEGIPCWIVPSWRVAEQRPARLGAFDLVIVDAASRSGVRELTTLLRGRKILVIGGDTHAGPTVRHVDHAKVEHLADTVLRPLPRTIRPLMLPGASLYDLAKVLFPGNHICLREHGEVSGAPVGMTPLSADERPIAPATSAEGAHDAIPPRDEPRRSGQRILHGEADVIVDEITKAVARLPRSNRLRRTSVVPPTVERQPTALDAAPLAAPPIAEDAASFRRIAGGDRQASAQPPGAADGTTAGEAAPSADIAIRATVALPLQPPGAEPQRSVSGRGAAVVAVVVLMSGVAASYWLAGPRMNARLAASGSGQILRGSRRSTGPRPARPPCMLHSSSAPFSTRRIPPIRTASATPAE
jgi:hypothetical protein